METTGPGSVATRVNDSAGGIASAGPFPHQAGAIRWRFPAAIRSAVLGQVAATKRLAGGAFRLLAIERDAGTPFNFVPVFLGLGILAYIAAPWEPPASAVLAALGLMIAAAAGIRVHGPRYFATAAIAIALAGVAVAQMRASQAGGPVIATEITVALTARVLSRETNRRGGVRYLLRPVAIDGFAPEDLPDTVRLTASARHDLAAPGKVLSGTARLMPFSGPLIPGGHDFGFSNWFSGLGATGYFLGSPRITGSVTHSNLAEIALAAVNELRSAMTDRIRRAVGGEAGDICAALITGERLAVDEATEESFRRSGLAHILSISGLHMVLVTLTVVSGMRFLLALSPRLAVNWPIRKWAAATGFVTATFYLFLSGAEVPTQRSYVMIAIMLAALLADRRAMDLRNVALAAIVVLCLTPEAVLNAGFQMSFAAAAGLVAGFAAWSRWQRGGANGRRPGERQPGILRAAALQVGGLALTSIIAGLATGLFAAWHFNRVAPMGLVANIAAMPVTSFVTMPLALLGVLLMPLGLERLALVPMGWSIDAVIAISDWVNGFPVPDGTGRQPIAVLALGTVGLLLLMLLRTRLRFVGLLPLAAIALVAGAERPPDLIIAQSGRAVAMRDPSGDLVFLYPGRDRFVKDIWMRAWPPKVEGDQAGFSANCSRDQCAVTSPAGVRVEIVYAPQLIAAACLTADVLATPRLRYVNCRGRQPELILKRGDFEMGGTHVVRFGDPNKGAGRFNVETAIADTSRPWNLARKKALAAEEKRKLTINIGGSARQAGPAPSPGPD